MTDDEALAWEQHEGKEMGATIQSIRSSEVPYDSLERSLRAAENLQMTRAAWQRGVTNGALCMIIVYTVCTIVAVALAFYLELGGILSFLVATLAFWTVAFVAFIFHWIRGSRLRGNVLLDCGAHPTRKMFWIQACLFAVVGTACLIMGGGLTIVFAAFAYSFSVYWVIISTGRLLFCKHGIWQYWSLLRWDSIESYRWVGETDATLMLQAKSWLPLLGRGALPVSIDQKPQINELLRHHAPHHNNFGESN